MKYPLSYGADVPQFDVAHILGQDLFLLENVGASLLHNAVAPLKFSALTCVFFERGRAEFSLNLIPYRVEAPALIFVRRGHILQLNRVSDDVSVSSVVISERMTEEILTTASDPRLLQTVSRPVIILSADEAAHYAAFYKSLRRLLAIAPESTSQKAAMHAMLAFFYAVEPYQHTGESIVPDNQGRIADSFLTLVQREFRRSRMVEYYADQLLISSKHLSRVVKKQTGHSPSEWIEKFVMLEAKVLLRSSSMSVQQIALDLGFPSQSFFGRYFKKSIGLTPRQFRNACSSAEAASPGEE